jgi:Zn-dependent protease/predicted transcriptional regulator
MENKWRIGSLFGIPFYLDYSWLFVLIFVTLINAEEVQATGLVNSNIWSGWLVGFLMALLLFISVLLHELGHSLVAKSQGIKVNSITLFLFGGVAAIERESKTPSQALQVAMAGPIVSMILFAIFFGLYSIFTSDNLGSFISLDLARINLVLAIFNLIPGLPLDGGQVLKAIVWKFSGDRFTGVLWAAASGKLLGWMGISLGLFLLLLTGQVSCIWLSLISWFILRNAYSYERLTTLQKSLLEIVASEVMSQEFRVINGKLTLQDFVFQYILSDNLQQVPYYAAADGRYCGLVKLQDFKAIERSKWTSKIVADITHHLTEIPAVTEKTNLVEVINKLENTNDKYITVLSPAGAVTGIIDKGNIIEFLAKKHNFAIPSSEIKQIREDNTYPRGLDLPSLVKNL